MKTKKELKEAYKQQKPLMGVFQVKNKVNGKALIEGSTDITAKWNRHQTELRFGSHRNKVLQKDWDSLGKDGFTFSVLSNLAVDENENLDLNKEVKVLKEMVVEELKIANEMMY